MAHTPGPWECNEVRTQTGRAFRIGAGEMLVAGKGCCIIYDDYPGRPDNERAANARLIAAAPEMLAALRNFTEGDTITFTEALDIAVAVIAKATADRSYDFGKE